MREISNTTILRKRLAAARAVLRGEAVAAVEVGVIHSNTHYNVPSSNTGYLQTVELVRWVE